MEDWTFSGGIYLAKATMETMTDVRNFSKLKKKDTRNISLNYIIEVVLVSLFLTLNRFHALFKCFHFWLQTNKYLLNVLKLTLSLRKSLSYRSQSSNLQSKSLEWFLYDGEFHNERAEAWIQWSGIKVTLRLFLASQEGPQYMIEKCVHLFRLSHFSFLLFSQMEILKWKVSNKNLCY